MDSFENIGFSLTENIQIFNIDKFIDFYEKAVGTEDSCNLEEIKTLAKQEKNVYYFDERMLRTNPQTAKFAWVDLNVRNYRGNPMFLSTMRKNGGFEGHLVSDAQYLVARSAEFSYNPQEFRKNGAAFIAKYEKKHAGVSLEVGDIFIPEVSPNTEEAVIPKDAHDVIKEVRDLLLINKWETEAGFRRYLLIIGNRIKYYVSQKMDLYYVKNNIGSVIVNTGLLNKFGQYINVMYRLYMNTDSYSPYKVILSKTAYVENGFTKEDASKELKPINFYDGLNPELSTDIKEYDNSYQSISHCVEARRDRFPESIRDIPDISLSRRIDQALITGLNIHRSGGAYAKAIYKAKENEIQWLLPLHIDADINESPELVMVISKRDSFYDIRTIFPYDGEVRDKIRAMAPYADIW